MISCSGNYLDEKSARKNPVIVTVDPTGFKILCQETNQVLASSVKEKLEAKLLSSHAVQIKVLDSETAEVRAIVLTSYSKRFVEEVKKLGYANDYTIKQKRSFLIGLVATTLSIVFLIYASMPFICKQVAYQLPINWEMKMGEKLSDAMNLKTLNDKNNDQILSSLSRKLTLNGDSAYKYKIHLIDSNQVNAFALPGGVIIVTCKLVEKGTDPDELAGIIAHEMEHIQKRHITQTLIRASILTTIWQMSVGDISGFLIIDPSTALEIVNRKYSRDIEQEADDGALRRLKNAQISPKGVGDFFSRLAKGDRIPEFLSTHPASSERYKNFYRAIDKEFSYNKALTDAQWIHLKKTCRSANIDSPQNTNP